MNDLVKQGYNKIAQTYTDERDQFQSEKYLEQFVAMLGGDKKVLDVGCGGGKPVDRYLVDQGCKVIGIDISEAQIDLAKQHVPEADYSVKDMSELAVGDYQVDGIVSFYAIFHTPRERHLELLKIMHSFLPKGGMMLITMGAGEWEGSEEFHGTEMHWSHFGAEMNRELFEKAGFTVILDVIDTANDERHQVLIGRKD